MSTPLNETDICKQNIKELDIYKRNLQNAPDPNIPISFLDNPIIYFNNRRFRLKLAILENSLDIIKRALPSEGVASQAALEALSELEGEFIELMDVLQDLRKPMRNHYPPEKADQIALFDKDIAELLRNKSGELC